MKLVLMMYLLGCFIAFVVVLLIQTRNGKRMWGGAILLSFLWPALLLFVPVLKLVEIVSERNNRKATQRYDRQFESELDASASALSLNEDVDADVINRCRSALVVFKGKQHLIFPLSGMTKILGGAWTEPFNPFDSILQPPTNPGSIRHGSKDDGVLYCKPCWMIGMSQDFLKATQSIDRKLQGRILEALTEISQNPTIVKGDTIKPLSKEFKGLWRYRLGDYRLIYQPLPDKMQILLVDFSTRAAAYG